MVKTVLILGFIFSLSGQVFAEMPDTKNAAKKDPSSIESLLNQAEAALMGSGTNKASEKGKSSKKQTAKKAVKKHTEEVIVDEETETMELSASTGRSMPELKASAATDNKLTPFDGAGVDKVLALDLEAQRREDRGFYPQTILQVGIGQQQLDPTYSLTKDDDVFTNDGRTALKGLKLEISPRMRIDWLSSNTATTFMSVAFGGGFFQGDALVTRTGIQPEQDLKKYYLFPGDATLQLGADFWNRVGLYISYGAGIEVIHQSGRGTTDSVSDLFYGEVASLGIFANVTKNIQVFVNYQKRGTRWLIKQSSISSETITGGLAFAITR